MNNRNGAPVRPGQLAKHLASMQRPNPPRSAQIVFGAIALMIAASASAADEPTFEVSGQVNAAMLFGGDIKDPEVVDNTASGTRLRLRASRPAFGNQTAFLRYEFQAQENQSAGPVDGSESFDTRFAEVGLQGGWGSLSLGKGEGATDGTGEGSYQVSGNFFGGGHLPLFTVSGTLNRDNASNVGWTYYDGFGRVSRLRYDSPVVAGFTGAISLDSGDRSEVAIRYRDDIGPGRLFANLGYADSSDGGDDRRMGLLGYKLKSGLSAAYSYSDRTRLTGPDLSSQLFSINYGVGKWIFSLDYGDQGLDGENEVSSIGFQYTESKPLMLYAAYTKFDNADGSSLDAFFVGARYQFAWNKP